MAEINLKINSLEVTIQSEKDDMTLDEIFEDLIEPLLLATGYHPDSIKKYLEGE